MLDSISFIHSHFQVIYIHLRVYGYSIYKWNFSLGVCVCVRDMAAIVIRKTVPLSILLSQHSISLARHAPEYGNNSSDAQIYMT